MIFSLLHFLNFVRQYLFGGNFKIGDVVVVRIESKIRDDSWGVGSVAAVRGDALTVHWMGDPFANGKNRPKGVYKKLILKDTGTPWQDVVDRRTVVLKISTGDFFIGRLRKDTLALIERSL